MGISYRYHPFCSGKYHCSDISFQEEVFLILQLD